MKKYLVIFGSSLVFFFLGILIGQRDRGADATDSGRQSAVAASQLSATGRKDEPTARKNGSFHPLRDKRGFLALEDYPTEEQRIMALYRALDDTTPENIKQMVDQYLAMSNGAQNRLRQLSGGIDFGASLMQRYGKFHGAEAIRFILTEKRQQDFLAAGIRGFVGESPHAAMRSFVEFYDKLDYDGVEVFTNETALAVLQKKISLQDWQAFMVKDVHTHEDFAAAIASLVDGKTPSQSLMDSLDMQDRNYLIGHSPEYTNLLDDVGRRQYMLEVDENAIPFDRITAEEGIAAVHRIVADSSLSSSQKAAVLRQYLLPTSYEDLKKHFSPIWRTLDAESKSILVRTNLSDVCELELDPAEMGNILINGDNIAEKMNRLVDGQDDPVNILNVGEYLNPSQRKNLIYDVLKAAKFTTPADDIRKWGEQAAFLSDDEYQWLQNVVDEREKFERAKADLDKIDENLKKMFSEEEE